MTKERFSRYIETSCKYQYSTYLRRLINRIYFLQRPFNHGILCIVLLLYYEHLTNTYYLPLTTDPRNPKPILPELLIHYLLLYNLSMISRYETDWWYDLLGSYSSEDYPFIYQFLSISAQKSLTIFQIFINGTKSISWEKKHKSNDLCFSCLATSYSHRDKVPTTIGARELNFRVRYGNGCDLSAIITKL